MTVDSTSCCGISLKRATIIIGVLASITSFMAMILSAAYAEYPHELMDMTDPSTVPDKQILKAVLITCAVLGGLQCLFSILIIFGAGTNRPTLLLPWLIYNPIFVILYLLAIIVSIVHHSGTENTPVVVGHLFFGALFISVISWKIYTVYRLYKFQKSLNF